jgi:hypothetical protein
MNTHASTVEHETGKRYMSGFHAVFSLGALLGGFVGGLASQFDVSLIESEHRLFQFFMHFLQL